MWPRLACAGLIEVAYAVGTRAWLPKHYSGISLELLTTAGRIVALIAFFFLFRQLIISKPAHPSRAAHPLGICALVVFLSVPVLAGGYVLPNTATQVVFAITSIAVALKEEVLYRGVLQNLLERRAGLVVALVTSNVIFAIYHYGAQPFTLLSLTEIFTAGCVLGLIYATTGSLMLAIAVHAVNDAIWAFTPLLSPPIPRPAGTALLIVALGLCVMWSLRSNKRFQPTGLASGSAGG